jgi:hypothetical protein
LRQEFGWGPEQEQRALEQYVAKVNHLLESAGQPAEPSPSAMSELTLERS